MKIKTAASGRISRNLLLLKIHGETEDRSFVLTRRHKGSSGSELNIYEKENSLAMVGNITKAT